MGETLASGTSATARRGGRGRERTGVESPVRVTLPGGELEVTLDEH